MPARARGEGEGRAKRECVRDRPPTIFYFCKTGHSIYRSAMTTIAWDGKTLAADTLVSWGGNRLGTAPKIAKRGKILASVAGSGVIGRALLDWFNTGMRGHPPPAKGHAEENWATMCLFGLDGIVVLYGPDGWEFVKTKTYADGAGGDFALGAMAAGLDAYAAVKIASAHSLSTGSDVMTLSIP